MSETWEVVIAERLFCFHLYSPEGYRQIKHDDKAGNSMNNIFIGLLADGWEPFGQSPDSFYPILRRRYSKTTGPKIP